jgi:hypothetical protein
MNSGKKTAIQSWKLNGIKWKGGGANWNFYALT